MNLRLLISILLISFCNCDTLNVSATFQNLIDLDDLSSRITTVLGNHSDAKFITIQMLDATSKIPSGIFHGSMMDLGDFDQCYEINNDGIFGKYCVGFIDFDELLTLQSGSLPENLTGRLSQDMEEFSNWTKIILGGTILPYRLAVCIPENMKSNQIPSSKVAFSESRCYSRITEPKLSQAAIMTMAIMGLFLLFGILSTSYDMALRIKEKKFYYEYLLSFSYIANSREMVTPIRKDTTLEFLNGIRSLAMIWAIACFYYTNALLHSASFIDIQMFSNEIWNLFLMHGRYCVNIFFILSALLTVYNFFNRRDNGEKFNLGYYYVHRYFRLTPAFLAVISIQKNLLQYFGPGPNWDFTRNILIEPCRNGWWSNILYLENYLKEGNCLPQAWYLQADVQLYFFSSIILYLVVKWLKVGIVTIVLLLIASIATNISIGFVYKVGEFSLAMSHEDIFYHQTWSYYGSYLIGMTLGYLIYKMKQNPTAPTLNKLLVAFLWTISIAGMIVIIFGGYNLLHSDVESRKVENVLYLSLGHFSWDIFISIMIFLCASGYGGWFNRFLSMDLFHFIAKLSYSMFLVSVAIIVLRYTTRKTLFQSTDWNLFFSFWGNLVVIVFFAVVLYLTVELPVKNLEHHFIIGNTAKTRTPKAATTTNHIVNNSQSNSKL